MVHTLPDARHNGPVMLLSATTDDSICHVQIIKPSWLAEGDDFKVACTSTRINMAPLHEYRCPKFPPRQWDVMANQVSSCENVTDQTPCIVDSVCSKLELLG